MTEFCDELFAFLLMLEATDAVILLQRPLYVAAVLEQSAAVQVVLANRVAQADYGFLGHEERPAATVPGEAEGVFVAVDVLVVEVGVFIVPVAEVQCFPAGAFIDEDLSAFLFPLIAVGNVENLPAGAGLRRAQPVGPEDRSRGQVAGIVKKIRGIGDGHVVGVEKQHFFERRVQNGIRLALPTAHTQVWMPLADNVGVDTLHA